MASDVPRIRHLRQKYSRRTYHVLMKTLQTTLATEASDVARYRYHVLLHLYQFGIASTMDAFKVSRPTIYRWKRTYEISGKKVGKLIPVSTAPHHVRRMHTDWRLVEFVKTMRQTHGNVGKQIIKPFLDSYAKELGIPPIGLSTIGKIIKRRHLTFETRVRIKRRLKFAKLRTRKSPKVTAPGFVQMDSIVVYVNQERYLFMCVMDIFTKYALAVMVPCLSSKQATVVVQQFQKENPTPIHTIQTDNGSEFLAGFHAYVEHAGIRHQFIYPHMPKVNAFIERFNRTIQEEFILRCDEFYYDLAAFKEKLVHYLRWFNADRPHGSLGYQSPLAFIKAWSLKCT